MDARLLPIATPPFLFGMSQNLEYGPYFGHLGGERVESPPNCDGYVETNLSETAENPESQLPKRPKLSFSIEAIIGIKWKVVPWLFYNFYTVLIPIYSICDILVIKQL